MNFRKVQDARHETEENQRQAMIQGQLMPNGITCEKLLKAFSEVDRRLFVPTFVDNPYMDQMIKINHRRMILSPLSLALTIQALKITDVSKVLVIGCNYGYSIAILSALTPHVYGVEEDIPLFSSCRKTLHAMEDHIGNSLTHYTVQENAPYDAIIIEGAIERLQKNILELLSPSGQLAMLSRLNANSTMCALTLLKKTGEGMKSQILIDTPGLVMPGFEKDGKFDF